MGLKLCLGCGSPTSGTRCASCQRAFDRERYAARRPYMKRSYRNVSLDGHVCACCGSADDLTRHHVTPLAAGDWSGVLVAMCRPCNSSIGSRTMTDLRCPMHGGKDAPR